CMTMNDHWGYNKHDDHWKSTKDLIQKLADIASKGGNFLLNVGPTSEGLFPQASIDRLAAIGQWMKVNGESIYGTKASLFEKLDWGRSTTKENTLYLHVFDWPEDGKLKVPGLLNKPESLSLLADPGKELDFHHEEDSAVVELPETAPDPINSVIVLKFAAGPKVINSQNIKTD
ncbi:MAG: alpha-L-fucosidase, partial [Candidatus Aminicenantes bacterium]|nr:alpha-L-fucosidase [Candidatus Aminicenantes bacterium]